MKNFNEKYFGFFILSVTFVSQASYNVLLSKAQTSPLKIGAYVETRLEGSGLDFDPCTPRYVREYFEWFFMHQKGYYINAGFRGISLVNNLLCKFPGDYLEWTLQGGRYFQPFGIRFGLREGGLGAGLDFVQSFTYGEWVSSIDALYCLRFYGGIHPLFDDGHRQRLLLKWTNKFYLFSHILLTAGIDHYNHTTSGFLGVGINF